jgi:hypothetical protein
MSRTYEGLLLLFCPCHERIKIMKELLIDYSDMKEQFRRVLEGAGFPEEKADLCATIFADNTLDGIAPPTG